METKDPITLASAVMAEVSEANPKELFCKDFDTGCFRITDPIGCKRGKAAVIGPICYYTEPVKAICPMGDGLH